MSLTKYKANVVHEPGIYITISNKHALGISSESPCYPQRYEDNSKHLVLIADVSKISVQNKILVDLGTKEEAIRALKYAIERLEEM